MAKKFTTVAKDLVRGLLNEASGALRTSFIITEIDVPREWDALEKCVWSAIARNGEGVDVVMGRFLSQINAIDGESEYPRHYHNAFIKKMMYEYFLKRGNLNFVIDSDGSVIQGPDVLRRLSNDERPAFDKFCAEHVY